MEHHLFDFHHRLFIQIRFNDVDGFGHINNAIYQEYFDLGRVDYIEKTLGPLFGAEDQHLVVVSNKTDFTRPLYLKDEIEVFTRIYRLGNKSLRMIQWLVKKGEETPRVTCDSVMVGFITTKEKGMVLPEVWRQRFNVFEKGRLIPDKD